MSKLMWLAWIFVPLLSGCSPTVPHTLISGYGNKRPVVIAVMPVSNDTGGRLLAPSTGGALQSMFRKLLSDRKATDRADVLRALREVIAAKLTEKGYRTSSMQVLDAKLKNLIRQETLSTQQLGQALHADAILYSSLTIWDTRYWRSMHSIVVEIRFTLVDMKTDETLWQGIQEKKSVAIRELQKSRDYLFYVEKVVNRVFSTLP